MEVGERWTSKEKLLGFFIIMMNCFINYGLGVYRHA